MIQRKTLSQKQTNEKYELLQPAKFAIFYIKFFLPIGKYAKKGKVMICIHLNLKEYATVKKINKLCQAVAHTFNSSNPEAEAGSYLSSRSAWSMERVLGEHSQAYTEKICL